MNFHALQVISWSMWVQSEEPPGWMRVYATGERSRSISLMEITIRNGTLRRFPIFHSFLIISDAA